MHLKNERYFVIAGFLTKELHKVISVHKKIEKDIKIKKHIDIKEKIEFKSSRINNSQQAKFLNTLYNIPNIEPVAIIIDKDNLKKFNASENVAYNFFVKNLLKYLLNCNISILDTNNIELRVDNRNISVKKLKDLETFLQWEFELKNLDVSVKYLDSKDNRDIQMADYVANMMWKKYNLINNTLPNKIILIYKTHVSKFPIQLFGHNPTLKELSKNNCNN